MAKIKINKLPEGFKLVDGKIEKNQSMKTRIPTVMPFSLKKTLIDFEGV